MTLVAKKGKSENPAKVTKQARILLIDNYDSFTYNLYDYFLRLGTACTVVRNDQWTKDQFISHNFDGLVLSPGPKRPKDAGLLMWAIDYFHDKKPILGICLGHQGLGEYFGATLRKANEPVHGKTSMITHDGSLLYQDLPESIEVMRYHSLILDSLEGTPLIPSSHTDSGEIMSFYHKSLAIQAVQFHPESILTKYGIDMLSNWTKSIK